MSEPITRYAYDDDSEFRFLDFEEAAGVLFEESGHFAKGDVVNVFQMQFIEAKVSEYAEELDRSLFDIFDSEYGVRFTDEFRLSKEKAAEFNTKAIALIDEYFGTYLKAVGEMKLIRVRYTNDKGDSELA